MPRISALALISFLFLALAVAPAAGEGAPPAEKGSAAGKKEKSPDKPKSLKEALLEIAENAPTKDIEMWENLAGTVADIAKHVDAGGEAEELFEPGGPATRIAYVRDKGARLCLAAALQLDNIMSAKVRAVIVRLAGPAVKKDNEAVLKKLFPFFSSKEPALVLAVFNVLAGKGFELKNMPLALLARDDADVVCASAGYLLKQGSKDGVEVLTARISKAAESGDAEAFGKFNAALREITCALVGPEPGHEADAEARRAAAAEWKKWWAENGEKKPEEWLKGGFLSARALAISAEPESIGRGLGHFTFIGPRLDEKMKREASSICLRLGLGDFNLRWLRARAMFALADPNAPDFTVALFRRGIPDNVMRKMISYIATDTPMLQDIFRMMKGKERFVRPETGADVLAARYLSEHHAWQAVPLLILCLRGKDKKIRRRALRMVENHFEPFSPVPWREEAQEEKLAEAVAKWIEANFAPGDFVWYKPTWKWLPKKVPFVTGYEPKKEKRKQENKGTSEQENKGTGKQENKGTRK